MNRLPLLLLAAYCLSACQGGQSDTRLSDLDVTAVSLPASVGKAEPLTLSITLGSNCSELPPQQFKVAQRNANVLSLSAQTTVSVEKRAPCPPVYFYSKQTYIDPGAPARTNPFEVFVNGESYGTVSIQ